MWARFKGVVLRFDFSQAKLHKLFFGVILTLSLVFSGLSSLFIYLQYYVRCSDIEGENHISETCRLYHANVFTGNMCSKLCDESIFRYTQCGGNRVNKMVQILSCDGCVDPGIESKVVLKSEHRARLWDFYRTLRFTEAEPFESKVKKASEFIAQRLVTRFQMDYSKQPNILDFVLGDDYKRVVRTVNTSDGADNVLLNILALGRSAEFLAMKILRPSAFIPKLYGTCGSSYFVEYTPPLANLNYVIFQGKVTDLIKSNNRLPSWTERATVGLQLLALVRSLETTFDRPIHMCDVNAGNIGLNMKRDVVLLDMGSIRFEDTVKSTSCTKDTDCNHNSCWGSCNLQTKTCRKEMRSNNLQSFCSYVFLSKVEHFGLFRNPPSKVASKLRQTLRNCAYPAKTVLRMPAESRSDFKMLKKIESLLKASLV